MPEIDSLCRIAVLVSGGGTNLQALIESEKRGDNPDGKIMLVASANPQAFALERAKKADIETFVFETEVDLLKKLKYLDIDLIVLAGFLKILSPEFIKEYPDRIINVHPALLPSFGGKGCYGIHVHEMALDYGVKVTGATVHYVNEVPDGGAIIAQKAVNVKHDDTAETLQKRVMEEAEWIILPEVVSGLSTIIRDRKE
ncbi:MAG: phosphoribosylglycinamide formyltransferase [Firmicutes bacterium]|nr:phosphoribosylglycinamide formyltransferase [Bacillota bacterium]